MVEVYIGLGANLGDAKNNLLLAVEVIKKLPGVNLEKSSSIYISKPWGPVKDQNDFHNSVIKISTNIPALELLHKLQEIENLFQRERVVRDGARTLDLDILLYGNEIIDTKELTVPLRAIAERVFVLAPLNEISPELCLPSGESVSSLLDNLNEELEALV